MRLLVALALVLWIPAATAAQSWSISGDEMRERHADTLEDLLRLVPLLNLDRQGAAGLPYRVGAGPLGSGELLLLVDGFPLRDPWSGENLYEAVPVSLIARVEVDLTPAAILEGGGAFAGVIRVETRRPADAKAETRIHLSRGSDDRRGRQLSFETPPGDPGFGLGLDEFYGAGYLFSQVWGGVGAAPTAQPDVSYSRRRVLTTRLDLDAGAAGPLELQLVQSTWYMNLGAFGTRNDYRDFYRASLALPLAPWGEFRLSQSLLERRAFGWDGQEASLRAEWRSRQLATRAGRISANGGGEWSRPGLERAGVSEEYEPHNRGWVAATWRASGDGDWGAGGGLRVDLPVAGGARLLYQGSLDRARSGSPLSLSLFAAGGEADLPWSRQRLPYREHWPDAVTSPSITGGEAIAHRVGALAGLRFERLSGRLLLVRSGAGREWALAEDGFGGYVWAHAPRPARHSVGLEGEGRWQGRGGELSGEVGFSLDLGEAQTGAAASGFGDLGYPQRAHVALRLSRPFFASDARLLVGGRLEERAGHPLRDPLLRLDLEAELRVLRARFWARLPNALNRAGQELAGFPIPPRGTVLGIDWHLDH